MGRWYTLLFPLPLVAMMLCIPKLLYRIVNLGSSFSPGLWWSLAHWSIQRLSKGEWGTDPYASVRSKNKTCRSLHSPFADWIWCHIIPVCSKQPEKLIHFFQLLLCCTFETELDLHRVCVSCCPFFLATSLAVCDLGCSPGTLHLVKFYVFSFCPWITLFGLWDIDD